MTAFNATQNGKNLSGKRKPNQLTKSTGKRRPTDKLSYNRTAVYGLEMRYNESCDAIESYRRRIAGGEYLSADDLSNYRKALDGYVDAASSLRSLSKTFGKGNTIDDDKWAGTVAQLEDGYKSASDYYSQWDSAEAYQATMERIYHEKQLQAYFDELKAMGETEEPAESPVASNFDPVARVETNINKRITNELMDEQKKRLAEMAKSYETKEEFFAALQEASKVTHNERGEGLFQGGALSDIDLGKYFRDGWQKGDLINTIADTAMGVGDAILSTGGDLLLQAGKGFAGMAEGVADFGGYGVAALADLVGADYYADEVRKAASENWVDDWANEVDDTLGLSQSSVLGQTSAGAVQGLGQIGAVVGTGGIAEAAGLGTLGTTLATSALMGASSMGSSMGEAYQNSATDLQALQVGLNSGLADAASELIFGGLGKVINALGFGKGITSIDDIFAKWLTKDIKNQVAKNIVQFGIKAGAEGLEEVIAGFAQAVGKYETYMSHKDFWEVLADENLFEQFMVGTLTSGIVQAPGFVSATKAKTDFVSGQTQNKVDKKPDNANTSVDSGVDALKSLTLKTLDAPQNGENTTTENTVSTETKTASQGDYEAAVEGKTIRKSTGEAVSIKAVASVDAGKMTLRLEDGSEVDSKEIAYSNAGEAYVFETVANLGVDAKEATRLINAFRNSGVDGKVFADGMRLAFEYGYGNFSQQELARMEIAGNIPQMYINTAYEIGQKMREQETNSGVQYSLRMFEKDGRRYVEIDQDQDRFDGHPIDEYPRIAKDIINEKFNGKIIGIDNKMFVNGSGRDEYANPSKHISGDLYEAKMRSVGEIDNLLDAGANYRKTPDGADGHFHPDVIDGFDHYDTLFKIGDRYYEAVVNIKNIKKGKLFKDVTKIKDVTQDVMSSYGQNPKSQFLRTSSTDSIRNPGETVNKKVSGKERGIYYTTKDGKVLPVNQAEKDGKLALKDKQSVAVKTAKFLQKLGLGGNYYFFESYVDQNGHRVFKDRFGNIQSAPNGLYYSDGDIYIDINAGTDSHSITLRTLSHELTHMIQQWSAAKYKGIADLLAEQYDKEGRNAYETAKAKQAELSELRGKTVSFQEAYHEFVADSMSTLFDDGNMYDILTALKKKDKTLVDYIKKFFDGLAAKVRELYGNKQAETDEGQFVQRLSKDTIYRLQQMFAEALVEASENYAENADAHHKDAIEVQLSDRETLSQAAENLATITDEDYLKDKSAFPFVLVMDHTPQKVLDSMENDDGRSMAKNRRIIIRRDALYLAIREDGIQEGHYHGLGAEVLKKLPEYLEQPDAILQTDGSDNRRLVLTHIQSENGQAIVSVEFESVKDYDGKNEFFNVIITVFDLHQNYLKGLFKKRNAVVKYEKEDLAQVNPQLHKWLRTFNAMSSNDNVTQLSSEVKQNSDRTSVPSNRALLAQALEGVTANMEDYQAVEEYRRIVPLLDAEEAKLSRLNAQIREITFGKGSKDREKLAALRLEAKQTQNRIDIYDKQLLKLEATAPLQKVLEREKAKAYRRAEQKGKEAVRKEKENAQAKYKELAEKNAAARKKGIESRERTAMRHKVQGVVSELNSLLLSNDKKRHVPDSLKKAVVEALSLVNMDTVGAEERAAKYAALIENETDPDKIEAYTVTMENILRQGEKMGQRLQELRDAYEEIQDSNDPDIANAYDPVIAGSLKELSQSIGNTSLRNMTTEQLSDVYDMYRMVLTRVRDANKAFAEGLKENIGSLATSVIREVKSAGGEHTYRASVLDPARKLQWDNLKPVYAMERLGSPTMGKVFETVRAGEDTWAKDVVDARKYYLGQSKKYGYSSWDFDKKTKFKSASGLEFELTLEQILSLYAYSKRDQAADHLRLGGFVFDSNIETYKEKGSKLIKYKVNTAEAHQVTPDILADITGTLTKEQKAFVDEMQDYLSTVMGAKGNEVTMKMYGVKLFKEKFYFPLKSAKQFMFEQNEVSGEVRIKNSGFTNKVVAKANNPVILNNFMDVWSGHVNDMSMYHAFVLPLEDFNRVFNYNSPKGENVPSVSVKGTIQNAYSPAAVRYVKQLITDLNGGVVADPRETFAKSMVAKFKKAKVFSSVSVVIQQPSAIGRAFALVDPKYFHFTKDGMKHSELWDELKQYAPVAVIKEMGYFDTDMGRSTKDFITAKEYSGIEEKAKALFTDGTYRDEVLSKAPALADELTWCAIWNAVKRETKAKNPGLSIKSEELLQKAGKRFTEVITKTQVYDSVLSRSANMRSKSGLMSMATSFMAEPTTTINMIEDALVKAKKGDKRYAARAFSSAAVSVILNNALVAVVYGARDDDDDETYLEKYSQAFVSNTLDDINPITYYPFLRDMWSLLQGYDIERTDMSLVGDVADALKGLAKAYTSENGDVAGAWWDIAGSVANIGGIPAQNIDRDVKGAINFVKTLIEDASKRDTTWGSMSDALGEAVRNSLPVIGWLPGETKRDKLYDAIVNGDDTYVGRLKRGYKDESAYRQAVRKALRENDYRIKRAADAKVSGDLNEYLRLAKEIIAEKCFTQDDVVAAINAEINAMTSSGNGSTSAKVTGMFKADDFAVAITQGDAEMASAIKDDIIQTAKKNGKTAEEAEKSFASAVSASCKEMFDAGEMTEEEVINALTQFCGKTHKEAKNRVRSWKSKQG